MRRIQADEADSCLLLHREILLHSGPRSSTPISGRCVASATRSSLRARSHTPSVHDDRFVHPEAYLNPALVMPLTTFSNCSSRTAARAMRALVFRISTL